MESYKGTFEEPKVKIGRFLHEIKVKGVREISEHAESFYKAPFIGNSQILVMISIYQFSDI